MDLSELIKSYNLEQKNVFTGFCIQLPLVFTILVYTTILFYRYILAVYLFCRRIHIVYILFIFSIMLMFCFVQIQI